MSDSVNQPHADEEWDDLLRQWRNQPVPQPRPYFYSRVRARLESQQEQGPRRAWLRWPAYAVMLGIVLLLSGDGAVLPATANSDTQSEAPFHGR